MRALKVLVIVMGLAILVGTAVLVTLIVQRGVRLAAGPNSGMVEEMPAAASGAPGAAVRTGRLVLPAGARVVETGLAGSRIVLRAALPGGGEALFVFDAGGGRPAARYDIVRE